MPNQSYIVKSGDTLRKIASDFGTSPQSIAKDSNISNINNIYIGQKLTLRSGQYEAITSMISNQSNNNLPKKKTSINKNFSLSNQGVQFLKDYEKFASSMYNDAAGHATIGYGHLIHEGKVSGKSSEKPFQQGLSEQNADKLLRSDLKEFEKRVKRDVKTPLSQNQFDALVIFAFNVGKGGFSASSALKETNKNNFSAVPDKMKLWNKITNEKTGKLEFSQGLMNRRIEETEIFSKGEYVRTR